MYSILDLRTNKKYRLALPITLDLLVLLVLKSDSKL